MIKRKSVREVIENPQENEYYVLVTRWYPRLLRMKGIRLVQSPFATWDRQLAPSKELLKDYKSGKIGWGGYIKRFKKEIPLGLIWERLAIHKKNAGDKTVVLVCIEENSEYPKCHTWLILGQVQFPFKGGYDTIVECKKCGKRQYLMFANGLKNGWSKCCGVTMSIVYCTADINKAVKKSIPQGLNSSLLSYLKR